MHKPSPSRMNIITSLAAAVGFGTALQPSSTAEVFRKVRGPAPAGRKFISGVYVPGGENPNVEPTKIRNPKIAAQMNAMHEKWVAAKVERIDARLARLRAMGAEQ